MIRWLRDLVASFRLDGPGGKASSSSFADEWGHLANKLTRPKPVEIPLGLQERIMHQVKACAHPAEAAKPMSWWLPVGATSAALAMALAAALWPHSDPSQSQQVTTRPAIPSLQNELQLVSPDKLISPLSGELVMVEKDFRNAAAQVLSVVPDLATFGE